MLTVTDAAAVVARRLTDRNAVSAAFFPREAGRLALVCQEMSRRFLAGGRLLAFGRGCYATDAQHVSVEFVHPVIVGKRALPALDVSAAFETWASAIVHPDDIVMGFGPPDGDAAVAKTLQHVRLCGAQTLALGGGSGDYTLDVPAADAFIHQEMVEILYHTLWETVHVFFEHRERGHDIGESSFLYPFLGTEKQDTSAVLDEVAASIRAKAADDEALRASVADTQADAIARAVEAMARAVASGASLIVFGNGGSATDANDWVLDCVSGGERAIPAVSLSMEPATISAVANDIGAEAVFLRQLIAQARRGDVAVAISTSGGSANVIAALREARSRGMTTVALLGYDGGEIVRRGLADFPIVVHCDYIPRIQEVQASVYHVMTEMLRSARQP
jgi:D-sedoheptulose 7-phosphate isomerase